MEKILVGKAQKETMAAVASVVYGRGAKSTAERAVAIGRGAESHGKRAVAIGHGAKATEDDEVVIEVDDWWQFFQDLRADTTGVV